MYNLANLANFLRLVFFPFQYSSAYTVNIRKIISIMDLKFGFRTVISVFVPDLKQQGTFSDMFYIRKRKKLYNETVSKQIPKFSTFSLKRKIEIILKGINS